MSKEAGFDLTPLIHFWGVQPVDAAKLKAKIVAAGLVPSNLIYDRLVKYRSAVPMDNAAFKVHAGVFLNKASTAITVGQSPDYGEGWYYVWLPKYAVVKVKQRRLQWMPSLPSIFQRVALLHEIRGAIALGIRSLAYSRMKH